jgi:protein XRP2
MGSLISSCFAFKEGETPHSIDETNSPKPDQIPSEVPPKKAIAETDYTFSNFASQTLERGPGSLPTGYPIVIENCSNAQLYILDTSSQGSIDECIGCTLVLGPTEGSLFLRDCRDCTVICSAQQVR